MPGQALLTDQEGNDRSGRGRRGASYRERRTARPPNRVQELVHNRGPAWTMSWQNPRYHLVRAQSADNSQFDVTQVGSRVKTVIVAIGVEHRLAKPRTLG